MEIFKDIKGYEGYYQISNIGNIKSLKRIKQMHHGGCRYYGDKFSKQRKTTTGYYQVMLCKNSVKKYYFVHRLVAINFIDNPSNKPQVNHIDGNILNNRVENLEWVTQSENQIHAYKTGLQKRAYGEMRGKVCKLKFIDVIKIKALINMGVQNKLIAKKYNVNAVTISDIKRGVTWKEV